MHAESSRPGQSFARYALVVGAVSLTAMSALAATLPDAAAEPSETTTSPTATSTTSTPTGTFRSDDRGYVGTAAHCDASQSAVAFGRTARALVAICVDRDGELEYRGVRLSDQASVSMPAGRTADGAIVASNDAVTYAVSPTMLLVSEDDTVLYRDAWVEFREPRFSENSTSSPTSTAASSAPSTATAAPTTTVSTTTVTLAPSSAAGN